MNSVSLSQGHGASAAQVRAGAPTISVDARAARPPAVTMSAWECDFRKMAGPERERELGDDRRPRDGPCRRDDCDEFRGAMLGVRARRACRGTSATLDEFDGARTVAPLRVHRAGARGAGCRGGAPALERATSRPCSTASGGERAADRDLRRRRSRGVPREQALRRVLRATLGIEDELVIEFPGRRGPATLRARARTPGGSNAPRGRTRAEIQRVLTVMCGRPAGARDGAGRRPRSRGCSPTSPGRFVLVSDRAGNLIDVDGDAVAARRSRSRRRSRSAVVARRTPTPATVAPGEPMIELSVPAASGRPTDGPGARRPRRQSRCSPCSSSVRAPA